MINKVWEISSGIGPCFPLAGRLCNAWGKRPIQRQPLLVKYKQLANPLLSAHNYTPLVISRNYKNMELTLSQRKLEWTAIYKLHYKIIGAPKKCKNQLPPVVRPSSVNFCQNLMRQSLKRDRVTRLLIFLPEPTVLISLWRAITGF